MLKIYFNIGKETSIQLIEKVYISNKLQFNWQLHPQCVHWMYIASKSSQAGVDSCHLEVAIHSL